MIQPDDPDRRLYGKVVQIFAGLALGIAVLVLLGWMTGVELLASWCPALKPMSPSTALLVLLAGLGLIIQIRGQASARMVRGIVAALALVVAAISGMLLVQERFGLAWDIESVLVAATPGRMGFGDYLAGRISPISATALWLSSLSLLLLPWSSRHRVLSSLVAGLALGPAILGFLITLGYAYGTPLLYSGHLNPPGFPTGLTLLFLGSGQVVAAGPRAWPLRSLVGRSVSARLMRVFLPSILLIILVDTWLRMVTVSQFGDHPVIWTSAQLLASIIIAIVIIISLSRSIGSTIDQAEARLRASEQKFSLVFHNNPQLMAVSSLENGKLLDVNEAWLRTMGFQRGEVIGRTSQELGFFVEKNWREEALEILSSQGRFRDVETTVRTKDGEIRHGLLGADIIQVQGQSFLLTVMTDITDRRQMELQLQESDRKYRELVENANSIILRWTSDGRISFMNEFGLKFFGYGAAEITGRPVLGTIVPEKDASGRDLQALIAAVCANPLRFEHNVNENIRRNGERVWIVWTNKVVKNAKGEIEEILSIGTDITERRQAEEALRQSEEQLRRILDNMQDGYFQVDRNGILAMVNPSAVKLYGYDAATEMIGMPATALYHDPCMREMAIEKMRQFGRVYDLIGKGRKKDGSGFWVSLNAQIQYDAAGQMLGTEGFVRDISERRQAEEALRASEKRYHYFVEQTTEGFYRLEADGPIPVDRPADDIVQLMYRHLYVAECNDAFAKMYGYANAQAIAGVRFVDLHGGGNIEENLQALRNFVLANYQILNAETREADKLGNPVIFSNNSVGIIEDGRLVSTWGTQLDITARKRAEAELRQYREHLEELVLQRTAELAEARDEAQAANRAKSSFLSNMSHELRTPLNAVLGFAQIMSFDRSIPERSRENLAIVIRSGEHLLSLINDILDLSKIEAGRISLDLRDVDLPLLIHDVADMMRIRADAKGLRLVVEQAADFPRFVRLDSGKFRQILVNLVGNAIKFTDAGQIAISFTARPVPAGHLLEVEVRDSGIGISRCDFDLIFRPFEQIGTRATDGTGLGLAITRQYVQMLGGEISVDSELGKGSSFRFTVPVGHVNIESAQMLSGQLLPIGIGSPTADFRILIVEDQPENRLLIGCFLEPFGFQLREAVNGEEAVAIFQQWHPHLVFMDRRMPVMDGIEATRRIRALPGGGEVIIVAVSAHSFKEEQQEMLAIGCDDFLSKPFGSVDLLSMLKKHLHLDLIYEETPPAAPATHRQLTSADLQPLPVSELARLHRWAVEAQADDLLDWASRPNGLSAEARQVLANLLKDYRFDTLTQAIEPLLPGAGDAESHGP